MAIVAPVLVALDEDRVATRDEEPGGRVAREVPVEVRGRALVVVLDRRLRGCAPQPRQRGGTPDEAALEHLVELAVGADQERPAKEAPSNAGPAAVPRSLVPRPRTAPPEARRGRGTARPARAQAVPPPG